MKAINTTAIIIGIAITFISCTAAKNTASVITYTQNVKAIIDFNCASSCHNALKPAGGIDLTTYDKVKYQALEGKLLMAIQHAEGAKAMPKRADKLDDATIQVVVNWVAGGASL